MNYLDTSEILKVFPLETKTSLQYRNSFVFLTCDLLPNSSFRAYLAAKYGRFKPAAVGSIIAPPILGLISTTFGCLVLDNLN